MSTAQQYLTAQLDALETLGVDEKHTYVEHGLTGSGRARPGQAKAISVARADDQLMGAKLERLTHSIGDANGIANVLAQKGLALSLGGTLYDPSVPTGKPLFNVPKMVIDVEADVIRMRKRKGKQVAKAVGRLRGKGPSFYPAQERHRVALYGSAVQTETVLAEDSGAARLTAYRAVERVSTQL